MKVRPSRFAVVFVLLAFLPSASLGVACGGSAPPPKAASGPVDVSIGDTAVANGGISELGAPSGATYAAGGLRADLVDKGQPIKLDGVIDEWPARTLASTVVKGSGDSVTFAVALQYDANNLYVGAEVKDATFVRTASFSDAEDHASLTIAFPQTPGGGGVYEIGLFAGKPGESEGVVRFLGARRGAVPGAKIVEAPADKGYTFEALIPWSALPEARTLRVGLRGVARYYDADGTRSVRNIVATGRGDPSAPGDLPALLTEPEQSMLEGVLTEKGLTRTAPKIDLYADISGDGMKERISVYDRVVTICGPGYRGGKEYFYRDTGADIVRIDARDLLGRGKSDLLVRRRFPGDDKSSKREWFEVWTMAADQPVATFAHEIVVARDGNHVDDAVHLHGPEIEVTYEPASGWNAGNYREPTASDVEPILLPWGTIKSQTFRFDGKAYKKVQEVAQPGAFAPQGSLAAQGTSPAAALPADVPTPTVRSGGDLSKPLLDQYRREQHVGADVKPRFDLQVNVDGDGRAERVVLLGRDIVVFGPGFLGGSQYAFLTLSQFADGGDVHDLVARDMTGDGNADLVVRGVRHAPSGLDVDAMFVYQVKGATIARIFAIETGREQGRKRAQGMVQLVPAKDGHGFEVDVRPGRVTGWTQRSYPWAQEQPGTGPVEPLLLPWGGIPHVRYAWNGSAFARP